MNQQRLERSPLRWSEVKEYNTRNSFAANFIAHTRSLALACGFISPHHIQPRTTLADIGVAGGGDDSQTAALLRLLRKAYAISHSSNDMNLETVAYQVYDDKRAQSSDP